MSSERVFARPWVQKVSAVLCVLALVEFAVRSDLLPREHLPPVSVILQTLLGELPTAEFWSDVAATLTGWALGLAIAMAIAIPLGMLIGFNELVYRALRPVIEFLRPVPSVALIPLAILVYGPGLAGKVFLAAFAATWPLLIQAMYGARDVDPVQLDSARSYRISRTSTALRVVLPSTVPYLATGIRIASTTSLILAVTAELLIGSDGLGRTISDARQGGNVELMYAVVVATGLLGWALNTLFVTAEKRVLHWHPSHRAVAA